VPLKPCSRCGKVLVPVTTTRCPLCELKYQSTRDEPVRASGRRSYGWKTLARETLQRDETCTCCKHARSKYAVHLDGKTPKEEGGLDSERVVGMCWVCKHAHRRMLARREGRA
jgi:hypothetical protein